MNSPNLFLVGFQKCGSSSLFDFLVQHPDIQGTTKKETFALTDPSFEHYDWNNSVESPDFSWNKYLDFSKQSTYYLEASVCNFYHNSAKTYISNLDNVKIIFLVRDPIERFISTYNYFGGTGLNLPVNTNIESYYDYVSSKQHSNERMSSIDEAIKFALKHGAYCEYIEEWKRLIGAENVLVLGMKETIHETPKIAALLASFLGVLNHFPDTMSKKNVSKVIKHKRLHLFLHKVFGGKGLNKSFLMRYYSNFNKSKPAKIDLPNNLYKKLREYYESEYVQLSDKF